MAGPVLKLHSFASLCRSKYLFNTLCLASLLLKTATIVGVSERSDHFDGFAGTRKQLETLVTSSPHPSRVKTSSTSLLTCSPSLSGILLIASLHELTVREQVFASWAPLSIVSSFPCRSLERRVVVASERMVLCMCTEPVNLLFARGSDGLKLCSQFDYLGGEVINDLLELADFTGGRGRRTR